MFKPGPQPRSYNFFSPSNIGAAATGMYRYFWGPGGPMPKQVLNTYYRKGTNTRSQLAYKNRGSRFIRRYRKFRKNYRGLPKRKIRSELKNIDTEYLSYIAIVPLGTKGGSFPWYGGVWTNLAGIAMGNGNGQRIGQKVQICRIQLKMDINWGTATTMKANRLRVIIALQRDPEQVDPLPSALYGQTNGSPGGFGLQGLDIYQRTTNPFDSYKILKEELIELDAGYLSETIRWYIKTNILATYTAGTSRVYDNTNSNHNAIQLFIFPEIGGASDFCIVRWTARVSYYDD